jgi:L-ascorbate metabolism protein UlaG (beta-lactamase superfamily)
MIKPLQQDDALLAEVAAVRAQRRSGSTSGGSGQSGFLVAYAGELMVFDPYLSDALTHKYAATDKPHVRLTERVVDPARLTGVSLVTSTHTHTDHLDAETLQSPLRASPGARLVGPGGE